LPEIKILPENNSIPVSHPVRTTYLYCHAGIFYLIFVRSFAAIYSFIWKGKKYKKHAMSSKQRFFVYGIVTLSMMIWSMTFIWYKQIFKQIGPGLA